MRADGWDLALGEILAGYRERVFDWSVHDCAFVAADAAHAMGEPDWGAPYRGRYHDYLSSLRMMHRLEGVRTLEAWADLRYPRVPTALAWRGDWALVKAPHRRDSRRRHPCLTVVDGTTLVGPCGARLARADAIVTWAVGREV